MFHFAGHFIVSALIFIGTSIAVDLTRRCSKRLGADPAHVSQVVLVSCMPLAFYLGREIRDLEKLGYWDQEGFLGSSAFSAVAIAIQLGASRQRAQVSSCT